MSFPDNDYMMAPEYTEEEKKFFELVDCVDSMIAMTCKLELNKWSDVREIAMPIDVIHAFAQKHGPK